MNPATTIQEAAQDKKRGITPLRIFLLVALPLTFRTFAYFPGMMHVEDAWYLLCLLGLLFVYPVWKIMAGLRFLSFEIYVLATIVFNMLMPAFRAHQVFGQPVIYGILAQRSSVLSGVSLFLLPAIVSRRLSPEDIQWAIFALAWILLGVDLFMLLFLDPASFPIDSPGFIGTVNGVAKFSLPTDVLYFALIYHLLAGVRKRLAKHYAIAAVFFVAILLFADSRAGTVSVACMFFYFVYRMRSGRQFSAVFIKSLAGIVVLAGIGLAVNPTFVTNKLSGFRDAFTVAFTGSEVEDASANVRILEAATAIPYILSHPFLGNGTLSAQWQGGILNIVGESFYPDDIGIIGVIYVIGILGLLFFLYQFRYSIWAARQLPLNGRHPMDDAAMGNLMYWAIVSLVTGTFCLNSTLTLFYITLLVAQAIRRRKDGVLLVSISGGIPKRKSA